MPNKYIALEDESNPLFLPSSLHLQSTQRGTYFTRCVEGPSWADQWGEGGFGALEDDKTKTNKDVGGDKKPAGSAGFGKAKAAALSGAQKVKSSTSMGIKWVKNKCQKKTPST
ncbi:hypothetical protein ACJIZ3_012756 [Penstemon smallii]|uniref:Uncharacterized protein n=1 Tax=Penstemon smallii TaxID=265156 RepID=A0ABD3UMZ9_9LAMI